MFKTQAFFHQEKLSFENLGFFLDFKNLDIFSQTSDWLEIFFIDRVWVSSYGENCLEVPKTLYEFVIEKISFFVTVFLVRLCAPTSGARVVHYKSPLTIKIFIIPYCSQDSYHLNIISHLIPNHSKVCHAVVAMTFTMLGSHSTL